MSTRQTSNLAKVLWYYNLLDEAENGKIVCPIHDDTSPSMAIDFARDQYFCFGCNATGDSYDLVREIEKRQGRTNDIDSYRLYLKIKNDEAATKASTWTRDVISKKRNPRERRQKYIEAHDYYNGLLTIDWTLRDNKDAEEVYRYLRDRGFTRRSLNLAKAKVTYNNHYPVVFPMLDNGKFRGWVCRTADPVIEKKRKYLYNAGFSRATTVVGRYGKSDTVIIVEGYMDWLKVVQYGIRDDVVAILGWKITKQQIDKLKSQGVTKIISALDNDDPGRRGTRVLRRNFQEVTRWQYLKGLKDIGDATKEQFDKMYKRTMKKRKDVK